MHAFDVLGDPVRRRILELLADGERVLDMPAKLSARVRVLDKGHGRKTDPTGATDAHAVVIAALRDRNRLRELSLADPALHMSIRRPESALPA